MEVGFIGLGVMGEPMTLTLLKGSVPLTIWQRNPSSTAYLSWH